MQDSDRFKRRYGTYKTPKFEYGDIVSDEIHGEVRIVGLTDALIPWPIGQPLNDRSRRVIVLFDDLAEAVKQEANQAKGILRASNVGRKASDETRKKLSEASKRRGARPPKAGKAWSEHEEELARTLPIPEVVKLTGRTYSAVLPRRAKLGVPDGRRRKE